MAGRYLEFPFDEEIFNYQWKNQPDTFLTTILESGAVTRDGEIARLISNGSNFYTTPYYNELGGDVQLYDGQTDFEYSTISGGTYSGVVYGRMKAWDAISFIKDFNSGADPMQQIAGGVANYWNKYRQGMFVKLLETIFSIEGDDEWAKHTLNLASSTESATEDNKIGPTSINDAIVQANGDNAQGYSLAIMHSNVAKRLANLQLLEFGKYTDISGIRNSMTLTDVNGMRIIINDNVPVVDSGTATGEKEYTTFVLGQGAVAYEPAPVDKPAEMDRNPEKNGGMDMIYTRVRETFAPVGFSFVGNMGEINVAIPDEDLFAPTNWERKIDDKAVKMARIITN